MRLNIADLLPDTDYVLQVRAVSLDGVSDWSPIYPVRTIQDTTLPKVPANSTWAVSGDSFVGEWDSVTTNVSDEPSNVTRYEVELVANGITRIVSVPQQTGSRISYTLTFEQNRALFAGPRPTVTFRVRAVDNKNLKGDYSALKTDTNPAPSAPTAPAVGNIAEGGLNVIHLSWTGVADTDLAGYNVYVGSTAGFTASSANRIFSGMATKTSYQTSNYSAHYFKIRAVDKFGQESPDLTANATPQSPFVLDSTAPSTPTSLAATITNNATGVGARASVTWSQAAPSENDLAGFYLRYRKVGDTNWSQTNLSASGSLLSGTNYATTIELQAAFTNYEFQIKSYDWNYNESAWTSTVTATSPANAAPANVTGLTAAPGRDSITYSWTPVADTDLREYEVTFSTSATFASGNITYRTGTTPTLTVGGLTPSTIYYARVRAVDTSGLTSAAWSSTVNATTTASGTVGSEVYSADWLSPNVNFGDWTGTYPQHWLARSGAAPTKETTIFRTPPHALRWNVGASTTFIQGAATLTPFVSDYVTLEFDVMLNGGTGGFVGAGMFLDWNEDSAKRSLIKLDALVPNPIIGKWYRVTKVLKRTSNLVGAVTSYAVYLAANYSTLGTLTAKDIIYDRVALRPATQEEITAYESSNYVKSRGSNLVTNGTGMLRNLTNFSNYQLNLDDRPPGSEVSFRAVGEGTRSIDEDIAVDPAGLYKIAFWYRQVGTAPADMSPTLAAIQPIDVDGLTISPYTSWYQTGTQTTLAAPLNPGDTTITLTSAANWYEGATGHQRSIAFFDYVDGTGKLWPPMTYSRNYIADAWAQNGIDGNVITLKAPYSGPARPAGLAVANNQSGNSMPYPVSIPASTTPTEWQYYTGTVGGVKTDPSPQWNDQLPVATARISISFLLNRSAGSSAVSAIAGLQFYPITEANAAQETADAAKALTDEWVFTGTTEIDGGAIRTDTIDVVKLKSGSTITQELYVTGNMVIQSTGTIKSSNYGGASGWKLGSAGIELNDAGSSVKADAIKAGTLGGSSGSGVINIAAGTSLIVNGGHIKSNTFNGTSAGTSTDATAGFYLGDDGLVIARGKVYAEAFQGGSFTTGTITMAGGTLTGGGWTLNSSGLTIPDGAISAAKVNIQVGQNLVAPHYADFEFNPTFYTNRLFSPQAAQVVDIGTNGGKFNTQYLRVRMTGTPNSPAAVLGSSVSDFNITNLEPEKTYILSYYARNPLAGGINVGAGMRWSDNVYSQVTPNAPLTPNSTAWTRYSGTFTVPAGITTMFLRFTSNATTSGLGYDIDGIQIEEKVSASTTPSSWTPPASTTVDAGMIRTGALESNQPAYDAAGNIIPNQKAWSINLNGAAVFGDALVRGTLVVGVAGEPVVDPDAPETEDLTGVSRIQSYNYIPGTSGWIIKSNGNAEFLQLASNSISADAISAISPDKLNPGTISADLVLGSSIRSIENETLFVVSKARTANVATLTVAAPHTRRVGDSIYVRLDQAVAVDTSFDTTGNLPAKITAVTDTTISYANTGADVTTTAHAGESTINVEGRSIQLDPTGLVLFNNTGLPVVTLPTDATQVSLFSGNVQANSLTIRDDFLLQGLNNSVAAGSIFTLNAGIIAPATAPSASFAYDSVKTWMTNQFSAGRSGLYYDSSNNTYRTANSFYGAQILTYGGTGGTFVSNVGAAGLDNTYGLTKVGNNYFVLFSDSSGNWKVRRYDNTGDGFTGIVSTWEYNRSTTFSVTNANWRVSPSGTNTLKDPTIGTDGTSIYLARCNKQGKIIVTRYAPDGTGATDIITNVIDNQHLKSINVGYFDYGATGGQKMVITTQGNNVDGALNYVVYENTGQQMANTLFPAPSGVRLVGTAWNGTQFSSLGENNIHYWYTSIARTVDNAWSVKSTWYAGQNETGRNITSITGDGVTTTVTTVTANHGFVVGRNIYFSGTGQAALDGKHFTVATVPSNNTLTIASAFSGSASSGTIITRWETPLSKATPFVMRRRAKLVFSTSAVPGTGGPDNPDRAQFWVSNLGSGGSHYKQDNPTATVTQEFVSDPTFSGATSNLAPFPQGNPSKMVSNNGLMTISADGWALFGSKTDVNALGGNTPALRLGDINANHLRLDGNEIQAMSSDTSTAQFWINNNGGRIVLGQNSRAFGTMRFGTHNGNTNSSGRTTTNHGMGVTPDMVVVTPTSAGNPRFVQVLPGTLSSTSFQVEHRGSGGAVLDAQTADFYWIAFAL